MKATLVLFLVVALGACTVQEFVTVVPRRDIPDGAREFVILSCPIDSMVGVLRRNSIQFTRTEAGLITAPIVLDSKTKAVFSVSSYGGNLTVIPTWGLTDLSRNEIYALTGTNANSFATGEMMRIVYNKDTPRTKKVFDYAVQLFKQLKKPGDELVYK